MRIATYNIHKSRGLDGRTRVERIARVLEKIDADIIALQEVVSRDGESLEDHQASYLANRLGRFYAVGETRKHRGGIYGNVTLSRWDFERVQPIDLTVSGRERRGALRTDIRVHQRLLHVFNLHLGTAQRERRRQAVRLMDKDLLRAVDIAGPRVVLGDFNDWTHGLVTRTLHAELHFNDLATSLPKRRNYPAILPLLHLDHIYYDHHFKLLEGGFERDRLSLVASDHLPLVAELSLAD
ncbi:MAG TPA: endonuclease/exonuclease/phosphatase family protein [Bryobacteraceae bacterium]|nr:endonuclease/exonuclease/phosphatase family protein [Bryobacteraceae bacterium]